jgi:hypothetical protein
MAAHPARRSRHAALTKLRQHAVGAEILAFLQRRKNSDSFLKIRWDYSLPRNTPLEP